MLEDLRRRRRWVSYCVCGGWYSLPAIAVYRAPVVAGVIQYQLAWLHRLLAG
ncbi:MAG TPA: hypothetical protein VLC98_16685 [Phnomibacter sp.]|nr:hypothetical protein [Phnomibacter sp.]